MKWGWILLALTFGQLPLDLTLIVIKRGIFMFPEHPIETCIVACAVSALIKKWKPSVKSTPVNRIGSLEASMATLLAEHESTPADKIASLEASMATLLAEHRELKEGLNDSREHFKALMDIVNDSKTY